MPGGGATTHIDSPAPLVGFLDKFIAKSGSSQCIFARSQASSRGQVTRRPKGVGRSVSHVAMAARNTQTPKHARPPKHPNSRAVQLRAAPLLPSHNRRTAATTITPTTKRIATSIRLPTNTTPATDAKQPRLLPLPLLLPLLLFSLPRLWLLLLLLLLPVLIRKPGRASTWCAAMPPRSCGAPLPSWHHRRGGSAPPTRRPKRPNNPNTQTPERPNTQTATTASTAATTLLWLQYLLPPVP